ncbi:sulfite exporter TauE/SafE family protein [Rubeoparvulum massiliense]|uniref:sulfite exporter TauE/SafE family protein n=1 Tax=Rubeoparvulum massiliense TaxID=1631346 RepID=UPI00065DFD4B|nr:sulfite exporter TauE/SafE family protein [Rubeoparvulum massiliense]
MEPLLFITIFLIGFIGSFISGMVGIGGAIIKYPMLLYIPPMLGLLAFTPHEVAGITAIQVFFSALTGVWAYRKGGYLNTSLIIYMGISILVGSFIGGYGSTFMPERGINIIYAIMATLAAIMMMLPRKEREDQSGDQVQFSKGIASTLALMIGTAAGVVGAGGAFLLVPVMLVVLKIPMRVTIATSLAVTFLSSIGATVGKVVTGQVLFLPAVIMVIASVLATPLGAWASKRTKTSVLQGILATLILATTIKIWWDIL